MADIPSNTESVTYPESPTAPTEQKPTYSPEQVLGEVNQKYSAWRSLKRPIEATWFVNCAVTRGLQNVKWNDATAQLETPKTPIYKNRRSINKILPKYRARKAKFLKNRYTPLVTPASSDKEDKLNATASQMALEYAARKGNLEKIYRQVLDWSLECGKAFIWLYWDDSAMGLIKDPMSGQAMPAQLGAVKYDPGSPFEVLIPDMGIPYVQDQPELMRVRAIPLEELKLRYAQTPGIENLKADSSSEDLFQYQKQIASLNAKTNVGMVGGLSDRSDRQLDYVVRKELFQRPCAKYPQGRYIVVAGNTVLKYQEVLPYQFGLTGSPYPVVEFVDIELAGQFWPTSMVEQLVGPQLEYNEYRQKLINHLNKQSHPKVIVSVYSKWPANAWNDEAGEVIKVITPPGAMEPKIIVPPPISTDLWQGMGVLRQEIDEISGIPPSAVGDSGQTTSGFQVNLLQEATDSVHAPDIRGHALAFEELYRKTRKIMAQGCQIPQLISMTGKAHIPDVIEFSTDNIDENAEVEVSAGSALSNSPAVRTQQVIELWNSGLLVDDMNPSEGKRRALTMLDSNGIGEFQEEKRRDEEKARLENLNMQKGQHVHPPLPFDDHQIHYVQHTDQMKTPDFEMWPPEQQKELFAHAIVHVKYINPMQAMNLALEMGMPELIPYLQPPTLLPQSQPPGGGTQGGQQQGAPPPQAPPPPASTQ